MSDFSSLTKDEISDWKDHKVTKVILTRLKENFANYSDLVLSGGTIDVESSHQTALRTTAIVARVDELRAILSGVNEL